GIGEEGLVRTRYLSAGICFMIVLVAAFFPAYWFAPTTPPPRRWGAIRLWLRDAGYLWFLVSAAGAAVSLAIVCVLSQVSPTHPLRRLFDPSPKWLHVVSGGSRYMTVWFYANIAAMGWMSRRLVDRVWGGRHVIDPAVQVSPGICYF